MCTSFLPLVAANVPKTVGGRLDSSTLLMRLLVGVEVNCFITFSFLSLVLESFGVMSFRGLYLTCMVHHSFFVSVLSLPRILGRIDLVHRFGGSFQGSVIKA
jgi:hypothetical protein